MDTAWERVRALVSYISCMWGETRLVASPRAAGHTRPAVSPEWAVAREGSGGSFSFLFMLPWGVVLAG